MRTKSAHSPVEPRCKRWTVAWSSRPPTSTTTSSARISPRWRSRSRAVPASVRFVLQTSTAISSAERVRARGRIPDAACARPGDRWSTSSARIAGTSTARRGATIEADAGGRRGHLSGDVRRRRLARPRGLSRARRAAARRWAAGATRRSTRKLARAEKPTYVLQLCFYTEAIAAIQGRRWARCTCCSASASGARCARRLQRLLPSRPRRFLAAIGQGARDGAVPRGPLRRCASSAAVCDERWVREDHLVLVAGIRREHVTRLRSAGVETLATLAKAPDAEDRCTSRPHVRERCAIRRLCSCTVGRRATSLASRSPVEAERGFDRLPRPSPGDVDLRHRGRSVLGAGAGPALPVRAADCGDDGDWRVPRDLGARPRAESAGCSRRCSISSTRGWPPIRRCTSTTTAPTRTRRAQAADGRRMPRARTRSTSCCARGVFVNLHTVVRQGLRAGVASYSLKEVEALPAFRHRGADVTQRHRRGAGVRAMDARRATRRSSRSIAEYNEEDCRATLALRDWLVEQHPADERGRRRRSRGRRTPIGRRPDSERARRCASAADRRRASPARRAGSLASCSSITGAKRGRRGGGSSSAARRSTDERAARRRGSDRSATAPTARRRAGQEVARSTRCAFPPQQYKLAAGRHAVRIRPREERRDDRGDRRERRACCVLRRSAELKDVRCRAR